MKNERARMPMLCGMFCGELFLDFLLFPGSRERGHAKYFLKSLEAYLAPFGREPQPTPSGAEQRARRHEQCVHTCTVVHAQTWEGLRAHWHRQYIIAIERGCCSRCVICIDE